MFDDWYDFYQIFRQTGPEILTTNLDLHFVCHQGCECDRIPAVDRQFVLRKCFQYRHSQGLVCWYNYYNDYPRQLDQYPLLALNDYLLEDYSAILTKNDKAKLALLSLQSFALFRAQVYLQQALGRCKLLSYHYHTYLHCQQELARIYGIPPVFSCLLLPSLAEPSYIALDGYLRFGLKPFFRRVHSIFLFLVCLCQIITNFGFLFIDQLQNSNSLQVYSRSRPSLPLSKIIYLQIIT